MTCLQSAVDPRLPSALSEFREGDAESVRPVWICSWWVIGCLWTALGDESTAESAAGAVKLDKPLSCACIVQFLASSVLALAKGGQRLSMRLSSISSLSGSGSSHPYKISRVRPSRSLPSQPALTGTCPRPARDLDCNHNVSYTTLPGSTPDYHATHSVPV